ncbi:MAG: hypothetical protein PWR12_692 [Eubacteriaceae bacterium]|jgi:hypothetical protein|nr:hypothetical protein [Eubacteriaceae bacterium]MDK2904616.1 hypothetical protein [Eubacteriaceae bacterium]MDK2935344.1 hypothetical protein [Eubacteriaceae bacterium]MDK2961604.1 hypothetical protein [Eubacteriaceae bacterium]
MDLEKLKILLGITAADQNDLLQFCIDSVTEAICNYCNVDTVPNGTILTAYRMAADLYRNENLGSENLPSGAVASTSMGDTSVSFKENTDYTQSLLRQYRAQLSRYRKLKW